MTRAATLALIRGLGAGAARALVDLVAGQSDAQSGMYSIRELERIRDRNLVTGQNPASAEPMAKLVFEAFQMKPA